MCGAEMLHEAIFVVKMLSDFVAANIYCSESTKSSSWH